MSSDFRVGGFGAGNPPPVALPGTAAATAAAPAPSPTPPQPQPQPNVPSAPDVLQQAAQRVVDAMEQGGNSFRFSFDKQSGMTIVRVINRATGELVRQIPTEEIVHLAQLLRQDEQRSLVDVTV